MKTILLVSATLFSMLGLMSCLSTPQPQPTAPPLEATTVAEPSPVATSTTVVPTKAAPTAILSLELPPATATTAAAPTLTRPPLSAHTLIVTNAQGRDIALINPMQGVTAQVEVGTAPWGLALSPNGRLYVSTAEGIAVVDLDRQERLALIPYHAEIGSLQFGEFRPGGMGLAVSLDGRQLYVGVYLPNGASRLEILDTESYTIVASVSIGVRPFDVLVSPDDREIYTVDHDSFTVTVVDPRTLETRTLEAAPLGRGAFDKPHYAALDTAGQLWLPFQGQTLARLDPATGQLTATPLTADTHQHGVTFTPDGRHLLIVGTGPAGRAESGPSLTIFDTETMTEAVLPLNQTHEDIAVSPDGQQAYLTGGNSLTGGWDGVTIVDLASRTLSELDVLGSPLDILVVNNDTIQTAPVQTEVDMIERNMLLIAAARRGEVATVKELLSQGASVHASDERGVTALIAAAYQNQLEVAEMLIEAGADVNVKDDTQQSAYLIPTADGYLELLKLTLAAGGDVHSLDSYNGTGLIRAADRGHVEIIQELLKTDIDIDHVNRLGWTALLEAIILGDGGPHHTEVVRLLVEAGADVNLADGGGVTPLTHAQQRGFQEIVAILEAAGATQ